MMPGPVPGIMRVGGIPYGRRCGLVFGESGGSAP